MRNRSLRIAKYAYLDTSVMIPKSFCEVKKPSALKVAFRYFLYLSILACIYCFTYFYYEVEIADYAQVVKKNLFSIQKIEVAENQTKLTEEIHSAINIEMPIEMQDLELAELKKELERNPSIKQADLKIEYPGILRIEVIERYPAAVWLYQNKYYIIDIDGVILSNNFVLTQQNTFPIVMGENANQRWASLLNEIQDHNVYQSLYAAQLISGRRWNLLLKNGIIIKLPENNIIQALAAFELILENYKATKQFNIVDLRLAPDKIYASF